MKKWFVTVTVWVVSIASAALLIHKIHRPLDEASPAAANALSLFAGHPVQEVDEPAVVDPEPPVLQLPVVTIVGSFRGSAEMQGNDDVVIGPGTVTHLP